MFAALMDALANYYTALGTEMTDQSGAGKFANAAASLGSNAWRFSLRPRTYSCSGVGECLRRKRQDKVRSCAAPCSHRRQRSVELSEVTVEEKAEEQVNCCGSVVSWQDSVRCSRRPFGVAHCCADLCSALVLTTALFLCDAHVRREGFDMGFGCEWKIGGRCAATDWFKTFSRCVRMVRTEKAKDEGLVCWLSRFRQYHILLHLYRPKLSKVLPHTPEAVGAQMGRCS